MIYLIPVVVSVLLGYFIGKHRWESIADDLLRDLSEVDVSVEITPSQSPSYWERSFKAEKRLREVATEKLDELGWVVVDGEVVEKDNTLEDKP